MKDAMADMGRWPCWESPDRAGWSAGALAEARAYAEARCGEAVVIVAAGRVVAAWGEVAARYQSHSMRKSVLSALIGIHAEAGRIDLGASLAELGIDDKEGLTEREKMATVLDLLTARSGIYHPSGYETARMLAIKPPRGSAGPGTHWCYNNWDFNALGTIFRNATGCDIYRDLFERIARPCGMEDFAPERDGHYVELEHSIHPAYPFRISARDLARFGELFLRHGRAGERQVVPAHWVAMSTLPISEAGHAGAYGYMWWVSREGIFYPDVIVPPGTYAARGAGGHVLLVVPALDAVIVHRVDTDQPGRQVADTRLGHLFRLILAAAAQPG
jgi:CubicO group peptidase (beta-lactamase class C family)